MRDVDPLAALETLEGYRPGFVDLALWAPYAREVCRRHGLDPCQAVRPALPGSYPTFVVGDRWVVKLFGRLFDGAASFAAEREANRLLAGSGLLMPAVIAEGELRDAAEGWPWPYLVFEYIAGVSIGEVWEQVSHRDRLALARQLGEVTRRLHEQPPAGSSVFPASWERYAALLERQRAELQRSHSEWRALPEALQAQLEEYVLPPAELIDRHAAPHLIHADLTANHILGRLERGRWQTLAIIDWGDAMVGNLLYELAALHLDLFRCDPRLLRAFLEAYGLDAAARRELPRRAMSVALLHQFNVLTRLQRDRPDLDGATSLEALAEGLWSVEGG